MDEEKSITTTAENKPRPKRGRGGTGNFPNAQAKELQQTPEGRAVISTLLVETIDSYKQNRVKTDEELEQRLVEYFCKCAARGSRPVVEELAMYCGYHFKEFYDIEIGHKKGFSPDTSIIIKKAKDFIRVFDAKLVCEGKMNPVAYIFRAKNYYGMTDQQELVLTPNERKVSEYTSEDIAKRYLVEEAAAIDNND